MADLEYMYTSAIHPSMVTLRKNFTSSEGVLTPTRRTSTKCSAPLYTRYKQLNTALVFDG